jgi:hypothetical protein
MTAIIVGRLPKANFIVVDSMVQMSLKVSGYKKCRLQDKISDLELSQQYLVLAGEEIIANSATYLNEWSKINGIKFDLFNATVFENVIEIATRLRQVHLKLSHKVFDQKSDVYIASREGIKYYQVEYMAPIYTILKERLLSEGEVLINYKGTILSLSQPHSDVDIVQYGIGELLKEHNYRKAQGYTIGKKPLGYDFENRFSSVVVPIDVAGSISRTYPWHEFTDMFLNTLINWDYVTSKAFKFTPKP